MKPHYALLFCLPLVWVSPAAAFYYAQSENTTQEARGLIYGAAGDVDSDLSGEISARLMYDADISHLHFEYHQVWQQRFTTGNPYRTQADRLNLSYSDESFHFKAGRQVINLATTFFFSPNDFFAPFSVQTFNRDYKQGVDALYTELRISDLTQLSALWVNNEYENVPTSSMLRFESAFSNVSWMLLAGEINSQPKLLPNSKQQVFGASIQSDIFESVGVRAEGHLSEQGGKRTAEWVIGLDRYWANDLNINLEWFHHGANSPAANLPYFASEYLALGLSYPFTPLLNSSLNMIQNMDDQSKLFTLYLNYSLSDESTLSAYALHPDKKTVTTEFGNYLPVTGLEILVYF